jgi:hypothetical protein
MKKTPLSEYVNEHGQTATAKRAGLSQGAIWQMLQSERQIFVLDYGDAIALEEHKRIGRAATAA